MKQGLLVATLFLGLLCLVTRAEGAVFNVKGLGDFQTALTNAQSNGEDDIINVEAAMIITTTLTYITPNGDSGHTLTINGNGYTLDGNNNVQIMSINTDNNWNGGDLGGDVTINKLIFRNGCCAGLGAGLYVRTGQAKITITNSTFSDNVAAKGGGGAYVGTSSGTATLINSTFSDNSAEKWGGGALVWTDLGTVTLTNSTFSDNAANYSSGGAYVETYSGTAILTNNIFSSNRAMWGGGAGVLTKSGTVTLTNNTFSDNVAAKGGGGAGVWTKQDSAIANIYNNIIYGNTANAGGNDGDDLYVDSKYDNKNNTGSTVRLYNNNLGPKSDFGTGQSEDLYITNTNNYHQNSNISKDPLFVNIGAGDFHLKSGSPCIDRGLNKAPGIPSTDFEGFQRIIGGRVDMGAYEYNSSILNRSQHID